MGIFNIFKKKQKIGETKQEKIKIENLNEWISNKKRRTQVQEEKLIKDIKNKVLQLSEELEGEKKILEKKDVEEIKAEEKIKVVVKENLNNYIEHLDKLIKKLKDLEQENKVNSLIEKINLTFSDFKKRSLLSFQKATFLVGKELGNVKSSINNFLKQFKNTFEQNKEEIEGFKTINLIETKIKKFLGFEKIKSRNKEDIKDIKEKIRSLEDDNEILEEGIKRIEKSKEYVEEKKKEEKLERVYGGLKKEIYKLREIIDFKLLADNFHSDEKKMNIIKQYRGNFKEAFEKDGGRKIVELMNEANIKSNKILEKIKEITKKKNEIENTPVIIICKNKIQELQAEIRKKNLDIENFNNEKTKEEKKIEKFEKSKEGIMNSLKQELNKIDVEVE